MHKLISVSSDSSSQVVPTPLTDAPVPGVIPSGAVGLAGIVARPHPGLRKLQHDLIDAVASFTVATGTSEAFATTAEDPVIDPLLIDYVSTFVQKSAGEHFSPHVTTGIALRDHLDQMIAEPFEAFTF